MSPVVTGSAQSGTKYVRLQFSSGPRHVYGTVSYMSGIVNSAANSSTSSRLLAKLCCPGAAGAGRGASREAAIRQAVVELLNEASYESVTMDAVAARAKASKATIYRRWSNKDELVLDALRGMVVAQPDVFDTGNLRDDIVSRIDQQMRDPVLAVVNTAALKVLVYAASSDPALAGKMREFIRDSQLAAWQTVLDRAHTRGELQYEVDAALMFEVIQGQFCARTSVDAEPVDDAYIGHLVDNVMMPVILHAGSAEIGSREPAKPHG